MCINETSLLSWQPSQRTNASLTPMTSSGSSKLGSTGRMGLLMKYHLMVRLVLCHFILCYAMLCYAMLCYAMLCYAMLCYAMLCCVLQSVSYTARCYAVLYSTLSRCTISTLLFLDDSGPFTTQYYMM